MQKNKKYLVIFFFSILILLGIGGIYYYFYSKENTSVESVMRMRDFTNLRIDDLNEFAEDYGLILEIEYQYSYDVAAEKVISQSIDSGVAVKEGDSCKVVVSKGEVSASVYQEYQVNELGRVPIMMYHGIVNISDQDTEYVGGNVDKDGYQRTVESFRQDLEFYYQNGYRMIRLKDYIDGAIDVELGYSPIILTFDDGSENNFKVIGEENGELLIDPNCAVGVLEEFKKKYPDYRVTATFFVNADLFQQEGYNEKILKWLINHGYDIGNHTMNHVDFTEVEEETTKKEIGGLYQLLDSIIPFQYVPIVALPFGSPYRLDHPNYNWILKGEYLGKNYETKAALRVGWESEVSCFDQSFQPFFLKRIRAYDNNGKDFDIEYNFKILASSRYISDGDPDTIVFLEKDRGRLRNTDLRVRTY